MREAEKGRRKAEVEAAQLRVEMEAQRRRGDDLQQRRGFAEAQVRTLTSTWCSIQVVRPQGTDTMSLHAHLRDGAPMALIVCVGSFTRGDFWGESGGLLNPSLREKRRHTRVCKGSTVGHARPPPKPHVLFARYCPFCTFCDLIFVCSN